MAGRLQLVTQALALTAVGGLLALLVWSLAHDDRSEVARALEAGERPRAPAFTLPRLDRPGELSLASLRGRVVVLNFWASWCEPCEEEAPALEEIWRRERARGLTVVGVNYNDARSYALAFAREHGLTFPLVRDRSGSLIAEYGGEGVPVTYVIDRRGRIVGEPLLGPVHRGELGERFRRYLEEALT